MNDKPKIDLDDEANDKKEWRRTRKSVKQRAISIFAK